MVALLKVDELSLTFGGIHALDKISLAVETGTITAIIGPNGAGKTSLFNIISGFYKPKHGRIFLDEKDIM